MGDVGEGVVLDSDGGKIFSAIALSGDSSSGASAESLDGEGVGDGAESDIQVGNARDNSGAAAGQRINDILCRRVDVGSVEDKSDNLVARSTIGSIVGVNFVLVAGGTQRDGEGRVLG